MIEQFNAEDNTFQIGDAKLRLRAADIKLIFGIVNGKRPINSKYSSRDCPQKDNSKFVHRRFLGVTDLKVPLIRNALLNTVHGKAIEDVRDVARLICLYICGTMLFATSGKHQAVE